MDKYAAKDVIRRSPSHTADTVAVLNRDSLCFARGNCVRSYDRMIEFGYEIPGWAILRFNDDSSWAQVILTPFDSTGPTGWVALHNDSTRAILWRHLLADKPLFFLRPTDIAFYAAPGDTMQIQRELVSYANSGELDYIMRPLESRERWLRVVLLTPSPMCKYPEPTVTPDTVWIQYLTPNDRPKAFYYTRGC